MRNQTSVASWAASLAMRAIVLMTAAAIALAPIGANADQMHAVSREAATVSVPAARGDQGHLEGRYSVVVRGPDGKLLHEEKLFNLVVNQGKNAMLDTFLGRGAAYAAIYFGLITTNTAPVAGDTYASHGFSEAGTSVIAARLAPTYGAAANGSKSTSAGTTFTITAASGATIYGLMQVLGPTGASVAGDTAASGAILYSAGLFSSAITVPQNSTITVNYSGSL